MTGGALPWRAEAGGLVVAIRLTPKGGRDGLDGLETLSDGRARPEGARADRTRGWQGQRRAGQADRESLRRSGKPRGIDVRRDFALEDDTDRGGPTCRGRLARSLSRPCRGA